mmetsp:Transcript_10863/g.26019  ORF Transcript_10863/g.26019 Transcript_10863/m.26019 type:complete len:340 (-) Transcript_10863:262-1281(-)
MAHAADPVLEAKARVKTEHVQQIIRSVEKAAEQNSDEDRRWLLDMVQPANPCFPTLVRLICQPKYKAYDSLRAVCFRALQMLLQIGKFMITEAARDPDLGWKTFVELAGSERASEAYPEIVLSAGEQAEMVVSFNAISLLAEIGPSAMTLEHVQRLVHFMEVLPDRASEISEVSLHVHAWGGEHRSVLCETIVRHPGGKHLVEVLLQMVNRCDHRRQQRALKVLTGCFMLPEGRDLLYTNDARVLVEILLRELPEHAEDLAIFECYTSCMQALASVSPAARQHRRDELFEVLDDLRQDDRLEMAVRDHCAEVISAMRCGDDDIAVSLVAPNMNTPMECS